MNLPSLSLLTPTVPKHPAIHQVRAQGSQEVGKQITNGDDALASCFLVYYDDSLEPKVRELLEHDLKTRHNQSQRRKRAETRRNYNEKRFATHRCHRVYAYVGA